MAVIDLKLAVLNINDNASETVEVKIGEGNLSYTEKKTREYMKNKGVLDVVRDGDEEPMEIRFDFQWEYIEAATTSVANPTIENALKQTGPAWDWTSTGGSCEPYAVDLEVVYTPDCASEFKEIETITFGEFRWETLEHDLRAASIACSGMCNVTEAVPVRSDAS